MNSERRLRQSWVIKFGFIIFELIIIDYSITIFYSIDFQIRNMQNRYPSSITTLSLVKSREILQKIATHLDGVESNRQHSSMIQSIQTSSQKVQQSLDGKIEESFNLMLNSPTLMPLDVMKTQPIEKENSMPTNTTALEGSKALMYNYWQRNKKSLNPALNKTASVKNLQSRKSDSKLPLINPPSQFKIGQLVRMKEKEQQYGQLILKTPELKEEYHIKIKIIDFKCQNQSKSYFKFQKTYYKRWKQIETIIKALERFCQYYNLTQVIVHSKAILDLLQRLDTGVKMTTHDLLACCQNAEQISEENHKQAGICFFGKSGKYRAILLIQAHTRRWLQTKRYKQMLLQWRSAKIIQAHYKCFKLKQATKQKIFSEQLSKLQKFNVFQKAFVLNYRKKELESRVKYQIHIPSHNYTDWQKLSMQNYLEHQNSQLCRIFKVAVSNPLTDIRIIYISPIPLSKQILNYYKKLLELTCEQKVDHKLIILTPQYSQSNKLPVNLSLVQLLYYSTRTLNKIKKIIKNQYAYIVPSTPSIHYVNICQYLSVPLYAGNPQKSAYLSTKSGCKSYQDNLQQSGEQNVGILPYALDIYNQNNLLNELTNLIYRYPYVKRWVLKIDNQSHSRGIAYIDVFKILGKIFTNLNDQTKKGQEKSSRQDIYTILEKSLVVNEQERIIPLDKAIYPSQQQYLQYYYTRGGIIEASINNLQTDLQNTCFCINLEPDGQWTFLCSYYKITNKHKTVGAYYDSTLINPPLQITSIINRLNQQKLFGYFTLEFLTINPVLEKTMKKNDNKVYYLNSIQCYLNEYSSAHYLRNIISKDSNALFIPLLKHPAIKQLRLQTFFHLCRLQNISFDIQKKVGNVFTFVDGLESSCLGIMTFNDCSRQNCYSHNAEVLDFFNTSLSQNNQLKDVPASFFAIKNAVNGYLNRGKKKKPKSTKYMQHA